MSSDKNSSGSAPTPSQEAYAILKGVTAYDDDRGVHAVGSRADLEAAIIKALSALAKGGE